MRQVVKLERGRGQSFRTYCDARQTNSYSRKEHRVGENCDTKKINEHRGVPQPGKCHLRITPFRGLGFGESGGNRTPAFNVPFAEKMSEPASHSRTARRWLSSF